MGVLMIYLTLPEACFILTNTVDKVFSDIFGSSQTSPSRRASVNNIRSSGKGKYPVSQIFSALYLINYA